MMVKPNLLRMAYLGLLFAVWAEKAFSENISAATNTISFEQAERRVLEHNPELIAAALAVDAAKARVRQAGAYPNPELSAEAENFGGSGDLSGWNAAETTYRIRQTIETAGKRGQRKVIALAEKERASLEYEARKMDVWRDLSQAFTEVLAAQEKVGLAEENALVTKETYKAIGERAEAGKVAPPEAARASVDVSLGSVAVERARRQLESSRQRLSALWGSPAADFDSAIGNIEATHGLPDTSDLFNELNGNPALLRLEQERALRRAAIRWERAAAIPNLEIGAGIKRAEETGDQAYVAELAVTLPLFDRNRGNIAAAEQELLRTEQEQNAAKARLRADLGTWIGEAEALRVEIATLRDKAIPAATEAFEAVRKGYQQGKYGYLDLLDAERALVEIRARHIEALTSHHKTVAEIGRLTANTTYAGF
jgi:outer membrane protein, heavy metal efflux system